MKTAIITGITGQTGSYLAELLLKEEYKIYGLRRRSSVFNTERIDHFYRDPHIDDQVELVYGDLSDYGTITNLVADVKPDLFFNLGAMSHVRISFEIPEYTMDVGATGVIRCLEAIRRHSPNTRFLQASTSEMFGSTPPPQNEHTPFHPRSPYAVAKVAGYWATVNYREAYKMFAVNAITFNHESPRRNGTFVTRKITSAATRIKLGLQDKLYLGNLGAKRDWSHASDVVDGMYKMMTADRADDYVIATGDAYSVKDFLVKVFEKLDMNWRDHVEIDPRYMRPSEVDHLQGDARKIRTQLGWAPKYNLERLVNEMVEHDLEIAKQEKFMKSRENLKIVFDV